MRFSARIAGKNWIFAIHPSQQCATPVKSRKSSVMPMNITVANVILIFLNIVIELIVYS